jgi:hypothetical protein
MITRVQTASILFTVALLSSSTALLVAVAIQSTWATCIFGPVALFTTAIGIITGLPKGRSHRPHL